MSVINDPSVVINHYKSPVNHEPDLEGRDQGWGLENNFQIILGVPAVLDRIIECLEDPKQLSLLNHLAQNN